MHETLKAEWNNNIQLFLVNLRFSEKLNFEKISQLFMMLLNKYQNKLIDSTTWFIDFNFKQLAKKWLKTKFLDILKKEKKKLKWWSI